MGNGTSKHNPKIQSFPIIRGTTCMNAYQLLREDPHAMLKDRADKSESILYEQMDEIFSICERFNLLVEELYDFMKIFSEITYNQKYDIEDQSASQRKNEHLVTLPIDYFPTGHEKGYSITLEFGGDHDRLTLFQFYGNRKSAMILGHDFIIPETNRKNDGSSLILFLAMQIQLLLQKTIELKLDLSIVRIPLIFVLGYSFDQTKFQAAIIENWFYNHNSKTLLGKNIIELLQKELIEHNLNIEVHLCELLFINNHVYLKKNEVMPNLSILVGENTYISYVIKKQTKIITQMIKTKTKKASMSSPEQSTTDSKKNLSIIQILLHTYDCSTPDNNLESLWTKYDFQLHWNVTSQVSQTLDKLLNFSHVGESVRYILNDLKNRKILFPTRADHSQSYGKNILLLSLPNTFYNTYFSIIASDLTKEKQLTKQILKNLGVWVSQDDCIIVQFVCRIVIQRIAKLLSAVVFCIIHKLQLEHSTIIIGGHVYCSNVTFRHSFEFYLNLLVSSKYNYSLIRLNDCFTLGAAALALKYKQ
ncbi:unnamed protein product [Didymodactylos carnosus]|uniref:Phosphotransferase n=1 Tax=Didymodactylos carnosus TaxID=1234261 RepID=A0A813UN81_9BILA|nr:unnamed protein product [Didymodactylos carnosus]CAF0971153.1 unnamed protein product [Didymodactylos carnosus]CAF3615327.1 unnamed protein product [Didymodactylos carnosus]CAF3742536.1 unnamed protein product [Didymodactylos carnosus]